MCELCWFKTINRTSVFEENECLIKLSVADSLFSPTVYLVPLTTPVL